MFRRCLCQSVFLSTAALATMLSASSGAWAQCADNFPVIGIINGQAKPWQNLLPLGTGSSLNALSATINTVNTAFLTTTSAFVNAPANPRPDQEGGGVWGRAVAGSLDGNFTSTGVLGEPPGPFAQFSGVGRQTCNTSVHETYTGYQVGADISILNKGGSGENWHWGITGGAFETKMRDTTPAGSFTSGAFTFATPPGSLTESSQVPFIGIYTAFTKGGFFADGQLRWDFYRNSLTDPLNGLSNQALNADGFSVTVNTGYNFPLQSGWFVEPSAGFVWSRVSVNQLFAAGLDNGAFARGTVTVDDIQSDLGRLSFTVGTTFTQAGVTWQPFFTASVFHEFEGNVIATSLAEPTPPSNFFGVTLTETMKGGVGTYGQYALGTAAVFGSSGWLGYIRGDYRNGDHIEGWSITGGLRYQLNPVSAPLR